MILVNSVGGCGTTMFMDYLEKIIPLPIEQIKFQRMNDDGTRSYSQQMTAPPLASDLFFVNTYAMNHVHKLNLDGKTIHETNPDLKQALAGCFLKLKHACNPPAPNIKEYGVLSFNQDSSGWIEFCQTDNKDAVITKAVYLHADPLDVLSTLFLKRANSEWDDTIHDHIIKCSPYDYTQLLEIFKHFPNSWDINDFSNWAYKSQIDPFGIEFSFDSWVASGNKGYPALVVKYETMWDNLGDIAKFLNVDTDMFIAGFPKKRERKRYGRDLEQTTFNDLESLFSTLIEKRANTPDTFITN